MALFGRLAESEFGLAATFGTFASSARRFSETKSSLRLIDGEQLVRLVLRHYKEFDSRYKGVLPLKRVYVPEPLDGSEELD